MRLYVEISLTIIAGFSGAILHELCHYVIGYIAGGNPFFSEWAFIVPHQVDFRTPEAMSESGVKATGGIVLIFPIALVIFLALHKPVEIVDKIRILAFLFGGSIISESDLFAVRHPKNWKLWTSGESISREE